MADLIDREALMADIEEAVVFSGRNSRNAEISGANKIIDRIKDAPAVDAEPVVRCKDCKNWDRHIGIFDSPNGYCYIHEETVNGYDYCSYGERKNDG